MFPTKVLCKYILWFLYHPCESISDYESSVAEPESFDLVFLWRQAAVVGFLSVSQQSQLTLSQTGGNSYISDCKETKWTLGFIVAHLCCLAEQVLPAKSKTLKSIHTNFGQCPRYENWRLIVIILWRRSTESERQLQTTFTQAPIQGNQHFNEEILLAKEHCLSWRLWQLSGSVSTYLRRPIPDKQNYD